MLFGVSYKTIGVIAVIAAVIGYLMIKNTKVLSAAGVDTASKLSIL